MVAERLQHDSNAPSDGTYWSDTLPAIDIDERYEIISSGDVQGHQGKLVDAFLNWEYPINRETDLDRGVIRLTHRWQATQQPDGSGVVESSAGGQLIGIRLADGTVIGNEETRFWFPYKSDYHKRNADDTGEVDEYDYGWFIQFPFRFVGEILTEFTDLDTADEDSILRRGTDAETFVEGPNFMRKIVGADILDDSDETGVLLTHDSGVQVYIGRDSTSWDTFELFGFVPFDGDSGVPVPSASDALDLLTPNQAAAEPDGDVVRQGEWFLVPTDRTQANGTVQEPGVGKRPFGGSPLDSHIPRHWRTHVSDDTFVSRFVSEFGCVVDPREMETPQDCVDALYELEQANQLPDNAYRTARQLADGVEVRGSLRHRNSEHRMVTVDSWRRATTHTYDVMTQDGQRYHLE